MEAFQALVIVWASGAWERDTCIYKLDQSFLRTDGRFSGNKSQVPPKSPTRPRTPTMLRNTGFAQGWRFSLPWLFPLPVLQTHSLTRATLSPRIPVKQWPSLAHSIKAAGRSHRRQHLLPSESGRTRRLQPSKAQNATSNQLSTQTSCYW